MYPQAEEIWIRRTWITTARVSRLWNPSHRHQIRVQSRISLGPKFSPVPYKNTGCFYMGLENFGNFWIRYAIPASLYTSV